MKIDFVKYFLCSICFIQLLMGCSKEQIENSEVEIFNKLLIAAIDTIAVQDEFVKGETLVFSKDNFDRIRLEFLGFLFQEVELDNTEFSNLARGLKDLAYDTLDIPITSYSGRFNIKESKSSTMHNKRVISIDASKIFYNNSKNQGTFYLGIYSHNNPSTGYVIYVAKDLKNENSMDNWEVVEVFRIWSSRLK